MTIVQRDDEMTPAVIMERTTGKGLGLLRAAALIVVLLASGGSVGLLMKAAHRRASHPTPPILLVLMTIWVLAPFIALASANLISNRRSLRTQATLYYVTVVLSVCSLVIYLYDAASPLRVKAAVVFVAVPLGSWLLMATVLAIVAFTSGHLSRRTRT